MKILFLIRSLHYGGAERRLEIIAKGLRDRGHDVVVSVFYAGGPLEEELQKMGVRVQPLHKRGRWDLLALLVRLAKVIREECPDIFHGYLEEPNNIGVLIKPLFPTIKIVWGVCNSMMVVGRYDWVARLSFRLSCRLSRFADAIISNSRAGCDYHVAMGYPVETMIVIPNGIDTERFRYDPVARVQLRSEWGVADHQKLIGLVARLHPVKDHQTFLKAAALLVKTGTHFRLVCVGDGPAKYKASLQDLAETLGLTNCVTWINARTDVSRIYSALDLLVSSSVYEGFSNVIGEAMACGVPCVATDAGDSAWIVADKDAIVAPKDPESLMAAMERMLNKSKYDPVLIRKRIVDQFSVDNLVANTEDILSKLLNNERCMNS